MKPFRDIRTAEHVGDFKEPTGQKQRDVREANRTWTCSKDRQGVFTVVTPIKATTWNRDTTCVIKY